MAVETGLEKQAYGITFTTRTANSGDWASVANSTYFYDIATDLAYYKDANGIVQKVLITSETTGVSSAIIVGGGGTGITDTDTFDGYTLAQVVKALRNIGILQ